MCAMITLFSSYWKIFCIMAITCWTMNICNVSSLCFFSCFLAHVRICMYSFFCILFIDYFRAGSGLPLISGPQGEEDFGPWVLSCMCCGSSEKYNFFFVVKVNLQGYLMLKKYFQLIIVWHVKENVHSLKCAM